MANQEQVTKANVYADIGKSATLHVSKVTIYAVVNSSTPPPPVSYIYKQAQIFTGHRNS